MTGGLIGLAVALIAATAVGLILRRRSGQFRAAGSGDVHGSPGRASDPAADGVLTEEDLGAELGARATLVQFSTAFCAPCRPTRQILAQVAGMADGVVHIDIDAAARLDLVRRLRINSTPTVLVLGPAGEIIRRASGQPRKADVIAALAGYVTGPGSDSRSESE